MRTGYKKSVIKIAQAHQERHDNTQCYNDIDDRYVMKGACDALRMCKFTIKQTYNCSSCNFIRKSYMQPLTGYARTIKYGRTIWR